MQLKLNLILVALLCLLQTNHAGAYSSIRHPSRKTDVLVYVTNNTSVTFNIRMNSPGTGWSLFYAVPGGTNIGPVPEGTYTVSIDPQSGPGPYSFNGFCGYTGTGYTVYWTNVPISASGPNCQYINISYF